MIKKQYVIYPFLFALYPVVTLLTSNLDQISPGIGLRAAIVLVSGTAILMFLFWAWMKDIRKSGLAVSCALFLIFSFKHIVILLESIWLSPSFIITTIILLGVFCILLVICPWLIWRFVKSDLAMLTTLLNVMAIVMLIFPLFQIITYLVNSPDTINSLNDNDVSLARKGEDATELPDIYYIIVDGYGRSDVLQEIYGHDNSEFLNKLTERGFYVADQSASNYMQTYLSLSSSLNFSYLDELAKTLGNNLDRRDPLNQLIQKNQVRQILEEVGYETVIYDSDWPIIESYSGVATTSSMQNYTKNISGLGFNSFESLLWRNTILDYFTPNNLSFNDHRNLIIKNFEGVQAASSLEGPQFVIGHVIAPHPPFVFNANGQHIQPDYSEYSINDGNAFAGDRKEYISGYAGQLSHINYLLLETVDNILANSEQPPIIIIQGDHGPGSTLDFEVLENNHCFKERLAILNAYYFPDGVYDDLYESISPVNTFRIVLNNIAGTDLDLVQDKSYFSLWNTPYNFVDVTNKIDICQVPKE